MGFDWGSLIGAGVQTGAGLGVSWLRDRQQPSGRNCLQGQVSGDEAMTNCVPRVMALFDELEIMSSQMSPAEVIVQARQIERIFSDPLYFDQSIGGRSRTIREDAKLAAKARADAIVAWAESILAAQQSLVSPAAVVNPATGTATTAPGEIDPKWILYGGAALLAVVLITK